MSRTQRIAVISVCIFAIIAVLAIVIVMYVIPEGNKVSFTHDEGSKQIKYVGTDYGITINYDGRFQITELTTFGKNILAPERGICLEYTTQSDQFSSLSLENTPVVEVGLFDTDSYSVVLNFSDQNIDYKVCFRLDPHEAYATFERTFKNDIRLSSQGFPSINLHETAVENIRWHRSGSNFWIAGKASNMRNFLAAGKGYLATKGDLGYQLGNVNRSMEDITFSLISSPEDKYAFRFVGESDRSYATEVQRYEEGTAKNLNMDIVIAPPGKELTYLGIEDGWGSYQGRTAPQGADIYRPVQMTAGQTDIVSFTIKPERYDSYFDLGTLKGINEDLLSHALNNYGRLMILDHDMGTSVESPNHFLEIPALEQHWNTNLISIFLDDAAIEAQKNGMRVIRDKLQAKDGHITSPYPWIRYDDWGSTYSDMMPGYVLSVVQLYNITGDKNFLDEMIESCIQALDYQKKRYLDDEVYLLKNLNTKNPLNMNDYWEHTSGKYNGYTTIMYYEALNNFYIVLEGLYGTQYGDKVSEFKDIAGKIQNNIYRMWSDNTNTFLYGSDNLDILYLPVQGAALRSGIVDREKAYKIVESVEKIHGVYNLPFHVMNVLDILNEDRPADQSDDYNKSMLGMNGGWYGAPDGDFYAGFPIYGDRTLIPRYINRFTELFSKTGFVGATAFKRDGVTPADYGWYDSMPTLCYPIWGLYTYGYGFQPRYDRLVIAPFIDESMTGSIVKYRFRQANMEMKYISLYEFELNTESTPAPIYINFINQTPDKEYEVKVDGKTQKIKADSFGNVSVIVEKSGKTKVRLMKPDPEDKSVNSFVGLPVIVSSTKEGNESTMYWSTAMTDGSEDKYWTPARNDEQKYAIVALGGKARVTKIILKLKENDGVKYIIEGTNDPLLKDWKKLADNSKKATSGTTLVDEIRSSYQYIRYRFISDSDMIKVTEIEFGG